MVIDLIHDLVFALQVNRATHKNKRRVKGVLIGTGRAFFQELVCSSNDIVFNAFLLAFVVYAHIAKHSQAKLSDLGVLLSQSVDCVLLI